MDTIWVLNWLSHNGNSPGGKFLTAPVLCEDPAYEDQKTNIPPRPVTAMARPEGGAGHLAVPLWELEGPRPDGTVQPEG